MYDSESSELNNTSTNCGVSESGERGEGERERGEERGRRGEREERREGGEEIGREGERKRGKGGERDEERERGRERELHHSVPYSIIPPYLLLGTPPADQHTILSAMNEVCPFSKEQQYT